MKFEVATSFSVKPIATADLRKVELQVNEILLAAGWDKKFCGLAATPEFFFGKCGNLHGSFIGLWARHFHQGAIGLFDPSSGAELIAQKILSKVTSQADLSAA
ncbi:hypothetical protein DZC30_18600 [Comamonas testosteroni]|uniref:Uncharacterized protein n=1 Tax=Comamonas testosteroni TaxID=285 RepID=A0A373FB74_COMTE|nr:hypothetical protein [Comamonas testosteroni]RGE41320.1 hypothetical protein DZC30_18600 [Comamonas testosteroni]